ncbi:MAG TPA: alpha-ketoglutarate-dependent dioxygenase AlkB [Waterburya sp.]|jgi:alkylated DNA repair dioxygenase AlkB
MAFNNETELSLESNLNSDIQKVSGLTYIADYISPEQQNQLLKIIDQQEWSIKANRRIQQYGYQYDYKNGSFVSSSYLGTLPDWVQSIANRLADDGLMPNIPDQVIVNEYQPNQGIVSHIDCTPCFGNTIITLSLGSACVMEFRHPQTQETARILLQPRSLLIFQGEARYVWEHGILACEQDNYQGREFDRTRRVSLTFREVLFPYK